MMLKSTNPDFGRMNWIPVFTFSFSIFMATLGILPLVLIVVAEIMPEKIKDACVSFCMTLLWVFGFISIKFLPSLITELGFHSAMFIFAGVCLFGAVFIIFVVPETKQKSHEEIMKSLQ